MNERILYTQPNGILAVIVPSPQWEGTMEELAGKDVPGGIEYSIVSIDDIPADRYFRNAWKKSTDSVVVDMPLARDIQRGKLRERRSGLFKKLDELYLRADEGNDNAKKALIAGLKKQLRDVTSNNDIDNANNSEELKNAGMSVVADVETQVNEL
jgi:hypothetical protein